MNKLASKLLDLIYPPSCHFCNEPLQLGNYLCGTCAESLKPIEPPFCEICCESFEGNIEGDFTCSNCHTLRFAFDFARSALARTNMSHQLVIDLKYHHKRHLGPILADYCAELLQTAPEIYGLPTPVIIPVPLHWTKKIRRGFNQSYEIAAPLSKLTDIPLSTALRRTRHTRTQTRLSRRQRLLNLKNAFSCRRLPEKFRSVILIDDVFTTGSTAHACAAALRKEAPQVENIVVVTALRG